MKLFNKLSKIILISAEALESTVRIEGRIFDLSTEIVLELVEELKDSNLGQTVKDVQPRVHQAFLNRLTYKGTYNAAFGKLKAAFRKEVGLPEHIHVEPVDEEVIEDVAPLPN